MTARRDRAEPSSPSPSSSSAPSPATRCRWCGGAVVTITMELPGGTLSVSTCGACERRQWKEGDRPLPTDRVVDAVRRAAPRRWSHQRERSPDDSDA